MFVFGRAAESLYLSSDANVTPGKISITEKSGPQYLKPLFVIGSLSGEEGPCLGAKPTGIKRD